MHDIPLNWKIQLQLGPGLIIAPKNKKQSRNRALPLTSLINLSSSTHCTLYTCECFSAPLKHWIWTDTHKLIQCTLLPHYHAIPHCCTYLTIYIVLYCTYCTLLYIYYVLQHYLHWHELLHSFIHVSTTNVHYTHQLGCMGCCVCELKVAGWNPSVSTVHNWTPEQSPKAPVAKGTVCPCLYMSVHHLGWKWRLNKQSVMKLSVYGWIKKQKNKGQNKKAD